MLQCFVLEGQVANAEVRKLKYKNQGTEMEVRKYEEKLPISV